MSAPDLILCADWGKEARKRAMWAADVRARTVTRVVGGAWTFVTCLDHARRAAANRRVILAFDVPLGVPRQFFDASTRALRCRAKTFVDWLDAARRQTRFFEPVTTAAEWRPDRPFFAVPPGEGSLKAFVTVAAKARASLYRELDRTLRAKPVFITSGVPGSVGSSVCNLWPALGASRKDASIWPFEGALEDLLVPGHVVVAEIYPRAAYATALLEGDAYSRGPLDVDKTVAECRKEAVGALLEKEWVRARKVTIAEPELARENEDDFDAMITAAALLRCALDDLPLAQATPHQEIEGGILCTATINTNLPTTKFRYAQATASVALGPRSTPSAARAVPASCPIEGCAHLFKYGRAGFDAHVASVRLHPKWHPDVVDAARRVDLFRSEFPAWFGAAALTPEGTR